MELTMNSATMEIKMDNDLNDANNDDDDDALSLRDLQMYEHTPASSPRSSPRTSSGQELFEFFTTGLDQTGTGDIVFCGKVIPSSNDEANSDELNEYQKRDYVAFDGSTSFRLPKRPIEAPIPVRSFSTRDLGSARHAVKFSASVKKVNITALTSMSSKSRRRMFMFGPVKFKPEMEISALRERQGRRPPSRMFSVAEGGDEATMGKVVAGRKCTPKNQRDPVKTLSCRARLNTVFEWSLACLRV